VYPCGSILVKEYAAGDRLYVDVHIDAGAIVVAIIRIMDGKNKGKEASFQINKTFSDPTGYTPDGDNSDVFWSETFREVFERHYT
jgi:hypothetical protein